MEQESTIVSTFLPYAVFINFRVSSHSEDILGFINTLSLATIKYKNLISLDGISIGPENSNFIFKIDVPITNSLDEAEKSLRCANAIFSKMFSFYPSYSEEPSETHRDQARQFTDSIIERSRVTPHQSTSVVLDSHLLASV